MSDIAAAAGVAPRTVSLHFPSKSALAASRAEAAYGRLLVAFEGHPAWPSALTTLKRWLRAELRTDLETLGLHRQMVSARPHLRAAHGANRAAAEREMRRLLAAEVGVRAREGSVAMLGGASFGVVTLILEGAAGPDVQIVDPAMHMLHAAMHEIGGGSRG